MPYIGSETTWRATRAARMLRGALHEDDASTSPAVRAALRDPALRVWLDSWIMPGLDGLVREVEEGRSGAAGARSRRRG